MDGATLLNPMRWPGPWRDPALIALLEQTPINCIVLDADVAPQPALKPVLERVRAAGLKVYSADRPAAGLDGVIPFTPRSNPRWDTAGAIVGISECVWPGVQTGGGGAGPTGMPWVDSNGWFIRLAHTLAPTKTIWLAFDPPKDKVPSPRGWSLAVADAGAYGADWMIVPPEGLAQRNPRALEAWREAAAALQFFRAHQDWRGFRPLGALGVLSDFAGPNEQVGGEILNLLSRRALPYRILNKKGEPALAGFDAVIYPDPQLPAEPLRGRLLAFIKSGGLLIAGPKWPAEGTPDQGDVHGRYLVHRLGKGRLAIAKEGLDDPYLAAADAHLLLGHRRDVLRLWNAGSMNALYTASADGSRGLVQLINYSMRPAAHPVTVGLDRPWRAARFWDLGARTSAPVQTAPAAGGIEIYLPEFAVYAAVELEK